MPATSAMIALATVEDRNSLKIAEYPYLRPLLEAMQETYSINHPPAERWDFWEICSEAAVITRVWSARGHVTGPPVDLRTGWDLSLLD
eukprot:7536984-Heterocapsa_arctica.AAC.1